MSDMAKAELKTKEPDFLQEARKKVSGAKTYICPACGNGSGKDGDGISLYTTEGGKRWKCFKCGLNEDVIGLWKLHAGISEDSQAFPSLYEHYHINKNDFSLSAQTDFRRQEQKRAEEEPEQDYSEYFLAAHANINNTVYHRGLSKKTLDRFNVGFVKDWKHPKASTAPESPRLIIPTGKGSYLARDTRKELSEIQAKYAKIKVGKAKIFNEKALYESSMPIFVVEGEIDAMSVVDVGGEAMALGSTANIRLLLEKLKAERPSMPLVLSLDRDEAGQNATKELAAGLEKMKIPFILGNIAEGYKDPNMALMENRKHFAGRVWDCVEKVKNQKKEMDQAKQEAEKVRKEAYLKTSTAHYLQAFMNGVSDSVNTPFISTGFMNLDEALDGGLYEGLYIMGAISSLGKTTLAMQIADQIAQKGHDVLIFSLEMARNELIAKSISRLTLIRGGGSMAKTARGITAGERYNHYSPDEIGLINTSIADYSKYADKVYILEGVGDLGVAQVRDSIERHIALTGKRPVVFVDYLQILAAFDVRASDKQNMDHAVKELRRICRDCKVTIIAISSLNRASYKDSITMEAFKESGAIEYASDCLIGLQLKGVGGKDFDPNEAKSKNPREVELVVLKNRNAPTGQKLDFRYYPAFNYFKEA